MWLKCDIRHDWQELSPVRRTLDTRQRGPTCSHCWRRWKEREGGPGAASGAEDDMRTRVLLFQQQHALKTTLRLTLAHWRQKNPEQEPEHTDSSHSSPLCTKHRVCFPGVYLRVYMSRCEHVQTIRGQFMVWRNKAHPR